MITATKAGRAFCASVVLIAVGWHSASAQNLDVKGASTTEGNAYFYQQVGVGTTTPDANARLHVVGKAGDNARLKMMSTKAGATLWWMYAADDGMGFAGGTDQVPGKIQILNNGNVGIGMVIPDSKLTVAGSVAGGETTTGWVLGKGAWGPDNWLRLTTTQAGSTYHDLAVNQFWSAGAVRFSDARYKRDVKTISGALAKVAHLRGVQWRWKDAAFGEGMQLGVVAQEVEKVIPEAVATGPDDKKGVAYDQLVGVLIEAVKEQQRSVEAHEGEIRAQREELRRLRAEVKALRDGKP